APLGDLGAPPRGRGPTQREFALTSVDERPGTPAVGRSGAAGVVPGQSALPSVAGDLVEPGADCPPRKPSGRWCQARLRCIRPCRGVGTPLTWPPAGLTLVADDRGRPRLPWRATRGKRS